MTNQAQSSEVLTVEETAAILKMHPQTVIRMLKRGELQGFQRGKYWRISRSALTRLIEGEPKEVGSTT